MVTVMIMIALDMYYGDDWSWIALILPVWLDLATIGAIKRGKD